MPGYDPGSRVVTPTGIGVFDRIFGGRSDGGPYDPRNGVANPGAIFGPDPFGTTQFSWNRQLRGGGIVDPTRQLLGGIDDSTSRFFGNGRIDANGMPENSWQGRWQQWFGTDKTGPDGRTLLGPQHQTGLRVGQDYGVRNSDGSIDDPWHSDMFQAALGVRNNLNQDNWLDPQNQTSGLRSLNSSSPYAQPQIDDYLSTMQRATGGPGAADQYGQRGLGQTRDLAAGTDFDQYGQRGIGQLNGLAAGTDFDQYGRRGIADNRALASGTDFDQYGQRGVDQTNSLEEANVRQLMRGIDRESQLTLAQQLPEIQQSMEAMGLGRSGAGQAAMLGSMRSVMNQANRDKQRTMADFQDRSANRRAQAINLATQQGYGGEGQKYNALSQAMNLAAQQGFAGAGQKFGSLADAINLATQQGYGGAGQKFGALSGAMNLGSQIGAQGYGQYAGQMGQAGLAGLGDQFQMNQANRNNEQALFAQAMQQRFGKNQGDQDALFKMLGESGRYTLGGLDAERMGQSQALQDYMGLVNNREQWRSNSLGEMIDLSDRARAIEQERLNQMIQAGYLPLNLMQTMITGVQGNAGYNGGSTAPWWQGAANGLAQGVGQGAGSWIGSFIENG